MTRHVNEAGIAFIKRWEGLRTDAYRDVAGVWTIGYGHTRTARGGMTITEAEADRLLRLDLADAENAVARLVTVPLTDPQFAALVSFTFNLGAANLKRSTLRKRLNAGDYDAVPGELAKWCKARVNGKLQPVKGLINRRAAEGGMWAEGGETAPRGVEAETGDRSSAAKSKTVLAAGAQAAAAVGTAAGGVAALDGTAQVVAIAGGVLIVALALFIMRERLRAWAAGWR